MANDTTTYALMLYGEMSIPNNIMDGTVSLDIMIIIRLPLLYTPLLYSKTGVHKDILFSYICSKTDCEYTLEPLF